MSKKKNRKTTFIIRDETSRRLRMASAVHDVPQSVIAEEGIRNFLDKLEQNDPDALELIEPRKRSKREVSNERGSS
jgi:hypothetical protein